MRKKNRKITAKTLSKRSIRPPWPGSIVPVSLMPAFLLSVDSKRSPIVASTDIAKANKCNETYTLLAIDVKNKRKEEERKKGDKKEREKKSFKTKKYIREWGN